MKGSNDKLVGYSDAAYGNSVKQCSTSGYIFILAARLIIWSGRKQPIMATSLSDAVRQNTLLLLMLSSRNYMTEDQLRCLLITALQWESRYA